MKELSHVDDKGRPVMVDVGSKDDMNRTASAYGHICLKAETCELIQKNDIAKGNVLTVAELAGISAAKRTSELIPLCHTLFLANVKVHAVLEDQGVTIRSEVRCIGKTGVEMEALTAVSVALLTVYDMCKAVDKNMVIVSVELVEKHKEALANNPGSIEKNDEK